MYSSLSLRALFAEQPAQPLPPSRIRIFDQAPSLSNTQYFVNASANPIFSASLEGAARMLRPFVKYTPESHSNELYVPTHRKKKDNRKQSGRAVEDEAPREFPSIDDRGLTET